MDLNISAIEDFDVSMKSKKSLQIFDTFIKKHCEDYRKEMAKICDCTEREVKCKIGEVYLKLFQLITVFNLIAFQVGK